MQKPFILQQRMCDQRLCYETSSAQEHCDIYLPFDVLYEIGTKSPEAFAAVRTVDRTFYEYTQAHIEIFKRRFSVVVNEKIGGRDIKYSELPNGDKHGLYQEWYSNGQLCMECAYVDGKRNGCYQAWHSNGQLREQCNYVDDMRDRSYQEWHNNGQLSEEMSLVDEEKELWLYQKWRPDGSRTAFTLMASHSSEYPL